MARGEGRAGQRWDPPAVDQRWVPLTVGQRWAPPAAAAMTTTTAAHHPHRPTHHMSMIHMAFMPMVMNRNSQDLPQNQDHKSAMSALNPP